MREAVKAGGGDASDGGAGSGGKVAAVRMLKAGREEMGAMGAAPGGAGGRSVVRAHTSRARAGDSSVVEIVFDRFIYVLKGGSSVIAGSPRRLVLLLFVRISGQALCNIRLCIFANKTRTCSRETSIPTGLVHTRRVSQALARRCETASFTSLRTQGQNWAGRVAPPPRGRGGFAERGSTFTAYHPVVPRVNGSM